MGTDVWTFIFPLNHRPAAPSGSPLWAQTGSVSAAHDPSHTHPHTHPHDVRSWKHALSLGTAALLVVCFHADCGRRSHDGTAFYRVNRNGAPALIRTSSRTPSSTLGDWRRGDHVMSPLNLVLADFNSIENWESKPNFNVFNASVVHKKPAGRRLAVL